MSFTYTLVNESTIISKILHEIEMPKAPKIALVGMASAGKSSLVNALFGNPVADVKKSANTTDCIVRTTFKSGLIIYDTPGVGGNERLENLTRAFLGLPQLTDFSTMNEIPFKEHSKDHIIYIPVSEIRKETPSDFVLFTVDLNRTLLRNEQRDIERLIREINVLYKNRFMVVGTHLDLIETLEEKQEIIDTYKSLSSKYFVSVSSVNGKGLDNLVVSLFNLIPDETYLLTLQHSLVDDRKLKRDRLVVIDASKRIATILMEDENGHIRKLRILALYAAICNHYSIEPAHWGKYKQEATQLGEKLKKYKKVQTKEKIEGLLKELLMAAYNLVFSLSDFERYKIKETELIHDVEKDSSNLYKFIQDGNKEGLSFSLFNKFSKLLL